MQKPTQSDKVWCWTRHASACHEDAWRERLAFLGAQSLVIHARPGTRMIRIEAYHDRAAPLRRAARAFGGKVARLDAARIVREAAAPRQPLRLGRDLAVLDEHGRWPADEPAPAVLLRISGAMAFGTGEHATTAACLRHLRTEAERQDGPWTLLDIGTGSGILAIAAEKFGARKVTAFDNDPRAVRAAAANLRRNRCRRVALACRDLLRWSPGRTRWPVVTANVFSSILQAAAPAIIRAVAAGGCLVISGILRTQEKETVAVFTSAGLRVEQTSRRGKWVTVRLRAPVS